MVQLPLKNDSDPFKLVIAKERSDCGNLYGDCLYMLEIATSAAGLLAMTEERCRA